MERLKGRTAVVTGGSRGIGRAIALEMAREGASVVVNYRSRREAAEEVVSEITGPGGRAFAFQADVTDETAVRRLVSAAIRQLGRIDILVTNAGVARDQLLAAMTLDQWEEVIKTHLRGTFLCIRETVPHMMVQKSGSIVTLSSIAADHAGRGHCNYVAAKGGINAMTRSLAVELAPKGIRVNAVSPGVILTDMTRRVRDLAESEILAQIPLHRFGEPHEVARAVCFLASDEASYITGEVLHVTGGFGL
ncbi:MAG: SDR family oxidoreductase [Ardenticatenaceae bacterium]|nr:SDR family oxidoreductase [Ardenticatenaceae bacterium]HBY92935.1 beta-ketoacyl-ACP reductase [Chloroflexota bacterium]